MRPALVVSFADLSVCTRVRIAAAARPHGDFKLAEAPAEARSCHAGDDLDDGWGICRLHTEGLLPEPWPWYAGDSLNDGRGVRCLHTEGPLPGLAADVRPEEHNG